ncbi:MAG: cytochrome c biogenesis protein [Myxococcota bacterium]
MLSSAGQGRWRQRLFFALLASTLFLMALGLYLVFFHAPEEATMGFVQKIFYFHVSSAWACFLAVITGAVSTVVFLANRRDQADRLAHAALEIGAVFGLMVLLTGPLWGYKSWGAPWKWDVRLTTFLVLELVLFAYLLTRAFGGRGARMLSAAIAIFGTAQIPLVYFSVDLWRGQHPPRVVAEGGLHPDMIPALVVCTTAFMLLYLSLLWMRTALGRAEARVDELHLRIGERDR